MIVLVRYFAQVTNILTGIDRVVPVVHAHNCLHINTMCLKCRSIWKVQYEIKPLGYQQVRRQPLRPERPLRRRVAE